MKIPAPKLPAELSFESVQAYKSALRRHDARRIAAGETTPHEVHHQNAIYPLAGDRKAEMTSPCEKLIQGSVCFMEISGRACGRA